MLVLAGGRSHVDSTCDVTEVLLRSTRARRGRPLRESHCSVSGGSCVVTTVCRAVEHPLGNVEASELFSWPCERPFACWAGGVAAVDPDRHSRHDDCIA